MATPDEADLDAVLSRAKQVGAELAEAETRVAEARTARTEMMKELHILEIPWAEIARIFGITPQAAMYACGHAQRKPKTPAATRQ